MMRGTVAADEYFMGLAGGEAVRSKDPNRQVGACLVHAGGVSVGHNGFPRGSASFPWAGKDDLRGAGWSLDINDRAFLATKHPYVVHAEMDAVLNALAPNGLEGCTLRVETFPCNESAKVIIQSGVITRVVYRDDPHHSHPSSVASRRMLAECGVDTLCAGGDDSARALSSELNNANHPHSTGADEEIGACVLDSHGGLVGVGFSKAPHVCRGGGARPDVAGEKRGAGTGLEAGTRRDSFIVHAEAVLDALGVGRLAGSAVYVTHFPCVMCAKLIVLSGCAEVVYRSDPKPDRQSYMDSREMLKANGVRIRESSGAPEAPFGDQQPPQEEIKAGAVGARSSPARKNYRRRPIQTSSAAGQGVRRFHTSAVSPAAPSIGYRQVPRMTANRAWLSKSAQKCMLC
ncbi:putative deoxycytidylate deaminase [Diplonema papillatum]|nr:putative deoxycytidylate deaminase [Diplonema papillatum]